MLILAYHLPVLRSKKTPTGFASWNRGMPSSLRLILTALRGVTGSADDRWVGDGAEQGDVLLRPPLAVRHVGRACWGHTGLLRAASDPCRTAYYGARHL